MYRFLLPLRLVLLLVCCLFKAVYLQILHVGRFDYTSVARSGKAGPVNRLTTLVSCSYSNWPSYVGP